MQANVTTHTLETWVPQFKFFGLGLGLVAITMALGTIIRRLRGLGQAILSELPRDMQPPARPLPRSVRIYQSLVIVGILILLGALIYGVVLAATDVPFVLNRAVDEIDAAQPGSPLLSAFAFVNSFAFWLDPLRLVGMAFLFTAITIALAVIIGTLRGQAQALSGFCQPPRPPASQARLR